MTTSDGRRDFDFLHGDWTIRNRRRDRVLAGCDEWHEFDSSATVRPILHGLGNVDSISIRSLPGVGAFEGATLRLFDPLACHWSIFWASTRRPGHLDPPLVGCFVAGRGVFDGEDTFEGVPIAVRFQWDHDEAQSARWQQSFSADGGQTWELNWVMEVTRIEDAQVK
jgi:hypothetical protein